MLEGNLNLKQWWQTNGPDWQILGKWRQSVVDERETAIPYIEQLNMLTQASEAALLQLRIFPRELLPTVFDEDGIIDEDNLARITAHSMQSWTVFSGGEVAGSLSQKAGVSVDANAREIGNSYSRTTQLAHSQFEAANIASISIALGLGKRQKKRLDIVSNATGGHQAEIAKLGLNQANGPLMQGLYILAGGALNGIPAVSSKLLEYRESLIRTHITDFWTDLMIVEPEEDDDEPTTLFHVIADTLQIGLDDIREEMTSPNPLVAGVLSAAGPVVQPEGGTDLDRSITNTFRRIGTMALVSGLEQIINQDEEYLGASILRAFEAFIDNRNRYNATKEVIHDQIKELVKEVVYSFGTMVTQLPSLTATDLRNGTVVLDIDDSTEATDAVTVLTNTLVSFMLNDQSVVSLRDVFQNAPDIEVRV